MRMRKETLLLCESHVICRCQWVQSSPTEMRTCSPVDLIYDDAVRPGRADDGLHLYGVIDAAHESGRRPVIAGVDLQGPVPAVPGHHVR